MSAETKKAAQETVRHLKSAEQYLDGAKQQADKSKDPSLIQRVEKVNKEVKTIRTDTEKKLTEKP